MSIDGKSLTNLYRNSLVLVLIGTLFALEYTLLQCTLLIFYIFSYFWYSNTRSCPKHNLFTVDISPRSNVELLTDTTFS